MQLGAAGEIARAFIDSKLTPLIIISTVLLGLGAILLLPREEEPQIKVPMVDVMVSMPGFSAAEVEERAVRPMEKLLWEIPGVEYLYSTSQPGAAITIVRFKVGEDLERSLVKLNQKLQSNFDRIPHGVSFPLIKPRSIDDVPILALTFHSKELDHLSLRRVVAEVDDIVKQQLNVSETHILGGARRQIRVSLDPVRMAARGVSAAGLIPMLKTANKQFRSGEITSINREIVIDSGAFLSSAEDVGSVVVGVDRGRPVYLRELGEIRDGPEEPSQYVFFGSPNTELEPAVTLTIAKRPGANAIVVADEVIEAVENLKGYLIPGNVTVSTTRHYGETAAEKSNELLYHMAIAIISVSLLILFMLGWRESLIVALAIPSTLALTLLVFYLFGFTLNRSTLFALIFSIGILVDDAIVVVENIDRHARLSANRNRSWREIAVEAVSEVGNPTILATFAVIAAVLPMAFVGGLMGPYMRPIPVGASAAMLFSLFIAFMVTPWATVRILAWRRSAHSAHQELREDFFTLFYRKVMDRVIGSKRSAATFMLAIVGVLLLAIAFVPLGLVKVKMLPFDNKSEFQIILNMPEGTALEKTTAVAKEIVDSIKTEPEISDFQIYAGVSAPYNFNGLVRHYFLRQSASGADIQINLLPKERRSAQSHDIAKRLRPAVSKIAERYNARVAVAEVPPGPPVLQTIVAEIYAPTDEERLSLARSVREIFSATPGVVDVDWYIEDEQPKIRYVVDRAKASLHGISAESIAQTLRIAVDGAAVDLLHDPREREDIEIVLDLPRSARTSAEDLLSLSVRSGDGNYLPESGPTSAEPPLVPLREIVRKEESSQEQSLYRKNLRPVRYVLADVAGEVESPAYAIFGMNEKLEQLKSKISGKNVEIYYAQQPDRPQDVAVKWDGEMQITLEVFRDLGLAFGACLILIYILMVGWFGSFTVPIIVMAAIPFSLVGILPAHSAMGAFFTATSMIGFMAGAGIVVRNSIVLVDFIEAKLREGQPLHEAVVEAGAVRFRPMLLTALAVVVGGSVILFDPIFQGLAVSLIFGEIASLLISRMAVPVLFYWAKA